MVFSPKKLLAKLNDIQKARDSTLRFWVAYSGGLDSHVLLHTLSKSREALPEIEVRALHIHHGLHADADKWQAHCVSVCQALSIPIEVMKVDAQPKAGESPEAVARDARYQAMEKFIQTGDCLLTAHHQDDQAETVLLQLLRGSGPRGLAAMPVDAPFGQGRHARPLLSFTRAELLDYAQHESLEWIEDGSNTDTRFDRNFIRHKILPTLKTRWPAAATTISRVAVHSAEASRILDETAETDLQKVRLQQTGQLSGSQLSNSQFSNSQLSIKALKLLTGSQIRNCLRGWLHELKLPLPSTAQMERVIYDVLNASPDASPTVHWPGAEIRRYRDALFAMQPLPAHDAGQVLDWDCREPLPIPGLFCSLRALPVTGKGLQENLCLKEGVQVKFRHGGEVCRPAGREHTHTVKKLMQEFGVPTWERDRIPMFHLGGQLAAVGKMWVCEGFQVVEGEKGLEFEWFAEE